MKLGDKVYDRWYIWWGIGVVTKVMKTRVRIRFGLEERTYDRAHFQFLAPA